VSDAAVTLSARAVLAEAWQLYRRLFYRSVAIGAIVFGVVELFEQVLRRASAGAFVLEVVLSIVGVALVQGGLVEIVGRLHDDGDDDRSVGRALRSAGDFAVPLVGVSFATGVGVGLAFLLLVVPGFVLMTRWAVAVPVVMLEDVTAAQALKRSRQIVAGNGWNVFKVVLATLVLTALVGIPFAAAARSAGPLGLWIALTISSALTAPFAAHALTVVYYRLVLPDRPVVLARGRRWQSIWDEERAS
jgi:hypothetical protein